MVAASEQVAAIRQEQKYRVFRLAGRPIIATPASPLLLRLAGLSQYRPLTKKRSLLRAALRIAAVGGVDGLFARTSLTPFTPAEDFGFQQWLNKIRRTLRMPSVTATVIWPQLIRRKRVYVHLMAPSGAPVAFCKISLDSANADRLKNEIEALTALRETGRLSLTRVPQILHQDVISGYRYVVYEPFPLDLVPLKHSWDALAPCVTEISGNIRRLDRAGLEQCDWWQRFVRGRGRHLPEFLPLSVPHPPRRNPRRLLSALRGRPRPRFDWRAGAGTGFSVRPKRPTRAQDCETLALIIPCARASNRARRPWRFSRALARASAHRARTPMH